MRVSCEQGIGECAERNNLRINPEKDADMIEVARSLLALNGITITRNEAELYEQEYQAEQSRPPMEG